MISTERFDIFMIHSIRILTLWRFHPFTDSISLSNGTLGCGWFKVDRSREKFEKLINENVSSEPAVLLEKLQTFLESTERFGFLFTCPVAD